MVSSCWAPGCSNRWKKGGKLYRFPTSDPERLNKWLAKIKRVCGRGQTTTRPDGFLQPTQHSRLCSDHFVSGSPSQDPMDIDYVPSIFQHTTSSSHESERVGSGERKRARHTRHKERHAKQQKLDAATSLMSLCATVDPTVYGECSSSSYETGVYSQTDGIACSNVETQTNTSHCDLNAQFYYDEIVSLRQKLDDMKSEYKTIQNELKGKEKQYKDLKKSIHRFDCCMIEDNDEATKYYTGLSSYAIFLLLFKHCKAVVSRSEEKSKISQMNEFFICLVKLRHNTGLEDFSYRYSICQSTVTNIFHAWLDALYVITSDLIVWPNTDDMELPLCFQNDEFKNVKCIIDCTEIFIERPTYLKARAETYSNYKKHNTVKYLIGISPSGSITFVSRGWSGRTSDKKITLGENFINKFKEGDVVMADRGFTLKEEFGFRGVKLIVPAFTRGKKQLSPYEIETSRRLARARIHVERVIGRTKTFKILRDTYPISLIKKQGIYPPTIDKIMNVVAGLINMCPRILE